MKSFTCLFCIFILFSSKNGLAQVKCQDIFQGGFFSRTSKESDRALPELEVAEVGGLTAGELGLLIGDHSLLLKSQLKVRERENDYQGALDLLYAFIENHPDLVSVAHLGLKGNYQTRLGQVDSAIETYRNLLNWEPQNIIGLTQLANLLILNGKFSEALPFLDAALKLEPRNRMSFWNKMLALLALGKIDLLKKNLKAMKESYLRYTLEAALYIAMGKYDDALNILNKIPETSTVPITLILRIKAQAYYESGRIDLAHKALMRIALESKIMNYHAIAALVKIERHEHPNNNFNASPALIAIMRTLSAEEITMVLQASWGNVWSYTSPLSVESSHRTFNNPFWSTLHNLPIDGQAVGMLRHR